MDDQIDMLRLVIGALEEMAVPYMVGGSMALIVWAAPRTTHDIDLVVDMAAEQIKPFCEYFPTDRFMIDPAAMREAFGQRRRPSLGMYSFLDMDTGFRADLFPLLVDDPAQQAALARRRQAEIIKGLNVSVYAPDDLLIQKLRWYAMGESERQFRDCLLLLISDRRRPQPLIDPQYVTGWAKRLSPQVVKVWNTLQEAVDRGLGTA